MTADRRTRPDVVLIAGGVGITPMRALFESMPVEPEGSLTLLYRARGPEHVLFRKHLDTVARRRGARVVYLLGEDPDLLSPASLRANLPRIARSDVYLCGPPGMADATRSALLRTGLPLTRLHEERFGW
jgi:ferredoxin-NADP reductase